MSIGKYPVSSINLEIRRFKVQVNKKTFFFLETLRVTFVVMEPYREKYSNRDSVEFQNLSQSLADSVNLLFESLPGTQKASLVRIQ